ncbi:polyprenyl synthetase family protein, partial [Geobacillus thermoleovorans]|uniref:polyprenyl synthetase family protein n=1 Tax=Geobacillus thermoleovorans TaxID=33941 RepID=UPI00345C3F23
MMLAGDLLDDLVDQDSLETWWSKAPPTTSLHMAIGLLLAGQKAIADLPIDDDKKVRAQSYILSRLLQSLNGQHMDVTNDIQTETDYLQMLKKKSGSLVAMACFVGTALAGAEKNTVIIEKYANDIGIAAQIDNDIDALYRWDEKNDIKAKKKSLPVLYMLASLNVRHPLIGMDVVENKNGDIIVNDIYEFGWAKKHGIHIHDQVLKVDGKPPLSHFT